MGKKTSLRVRGFWARAVQNPHSDEQQSSHSNSRKIAEVVVSTGCGCRSVCRASVQRIRRGAENAYNKAASSFSQSSKTNAEAFSEEYRWEEDDDGWNVIASSSAGKSCPPGSPVSSPEFAASAACKSGGRKKKFFREFSSCSEDETLFSSCEKSDACRSFSSEESSPELRPSRPRRSRRRSFARRQKVSVPYEKLRKKACRKKDPQENEKCFRGEESMAKVWVKEDLRRVISRAPSAEPCLPFSVVSCARNSFRFAYRPCAKTNRSSPKKSPRSSYSSTSAVSSSSSSVRRSFSLSVVAGKVNSPGRMAESVAVVKNSTDPYADFKASMLEMIVEKEIFNVRDLQKLLRYFVSLNSPQHHDMIFTAFSEICSAVFSLTPSPRRSSDRTPRLSSAK